MQIKISFDEISGNLFKYVCDQYQPDARFPYPLQKGQKGSLLGSVFAVYIAYMLRRTEQLPGSGLILEEILSLRNADTGLFDDPDVKKSHFLNPDSHSELYVQLQTSSFCYAALHALGANVDRRVHWLEPLFKDGRLKEWLHQLDWTNPWLVSNLDMFIGIFLLEWQSVEKNNVQVNKSVNEYFDWHDETQISKTGYWGNQDDLLNAMAGAYHIFIHYDFTGKRLNFENEVIDATLKLVCRDGLFVHGGGGGSCEDMDAIDILVRYSLATDYRNNDVKNVLLRAASMLSFGQCKDGGFSWRVQPKLSNLMQIPLRFNSKKKLFFGVWHNIIYKSVHRSHYCSTHNYSSLSLYPYNLTESDMWSSWFRPLSLAFIAQRYPKAFVHDCDWRMPFWPGLGYDPFDSIHTRAI